MAKYLQLQHSLRVVFSSLFLFYFQKSPLHVCMYVDKQKKIESTAPVLAPNGMFGMSGMSGMCDVTRYQVDTKGVQFSSICVNIVLFSTQRSFVFKHLCKNCIVLDTKSFVFKHLCKYCIVLKHLCKYFIFLDTQRSDDV